MHKKMIMILLLGAGAILLIMIAILLTNQYLPTLSQPAETPQEPAPTPYASTPETSVMRYLAYWNDKDAQRMDSAWAPEARDASPDYDLEWIERVEALSARKQPASSIPQELASKFSSMHDIAYVLADYTVFYNEAGQATGMQEESKRSDFPFLLVQKSAGDEWLIAAFGY